MDHQHACDGVMLKVDLETNLLFVPYLFWDMQHYSSRSTFSCEGSTANVTWATLFQIAQRLCFLPKYVFNPKAWEQTHSIPRTCMPKDGAPHMQAPRQHACLACPQAHAILRHGRPGELPVAHTDLHTHATHKDSHEHIMVLALTWQYMGPGRAIAWPKAVSYCSHHAHSRRWGGAR